MPARDGSLPELHIWGPAFGLPSIDVECIAATVYLDQLLQKDDWRLVVGHDPSTSPNGAFPFLRDGERSLSGFSAIVDHLCSKGLSLDLHLSPRQRADTTALRAHLLTHALPLVDAHLYTSSSNYIHTVRPAWSPILPSPFRQAVLSWRYNQALRRTAPLGLSTASADDLPDPEFTPQQEQEARMISSRPSLLFRRRQTVLAALRREQLDMKFRLGSMTDTLMEPLAAFLGEKQYLVSEDGLTSIDCLCFGYLALLLHVKCESNWIAEAMRRDHGAVCQYIDSLKSKFVGPQSFNVDRIMAAPALSGESSPLIHNLPYRTADPPTLRSRISTIATSLLLRVFSPSQLHLLFPSHSFACINEPHTSSLRAWLSPLTVLFTIMGPVLASAGWMLYVATHTDLERDKRFMRPGPVFRGVSGGAVFSGLGMAGVRPGYQDAGNGRASDVDGRASQTREQDRPGTPVGEKDGLEVEVTTE